MKYLLVTLTVFISTKAWSLSLPYCTNFSNDVVDYIFESCVNRNFSTVARELNTNYRYCYNFNNAPGVDFMFESCINQNFERVGRDLNIYLRRCINFSSDQVDFSFISCVNYNYTTIARKIP